MMIPTEDEFREALYEEYSEIDNERIFNNFVGSRKMERMIKKNKIRNKKQK